MFEQCKGNQGLNPRVKAQGSARHVFWASRPEKLSKSTKKFFLKK